MQSHTIDLYSPYLNKLFAPFSLSSPIKCFVIPPKTKVEKKTTKKPFALCSLAHKFATVSWSSCCFPRELVSFDQRHVIRFPPILKRIWVRRNFLAMANFSPKNWWSHLNFICILAIQITLIHFMSHSCHGKRCFDKWVLVEHCSANIESHWFESRWSPENFFSG